MTDILIQLEEIKDYIPEQTYRTIIGQVKAGDRGGATVGINRLKKRIAKEALKYETCRC